MSFKFSKTSRNPEIQRLQKEIQDNFVSVDKNGNVVLNGNITAQDGIFSANSIYLGVVKITAPQSSDNGLVWKYDNSAKKKLVMTNDVSGDVDAAPSTHASSHESGGSDTIDHDSLTGFVANEHLPGIDEDDMASNSATSVPTQQSVRQFADTVLDIITSTTTVSNDDTEQTIYTSAVAADSLVAGEIMKLHCSGVLSNDTASDDITIRVKMGGTTLETFNPAIGNVTDAEWDLDYEFTVRSLGATGSIAQNGEIRIDASTNNVHSIETVDTTSANNLVVTVQWDNAKAGNTISIYQGYRENKGSK